MEFIREAQAKYEALGYKFTEKYEVANIGTKYTVSILDKDGNEVAKSSSTYGNASGRGYGMSFAQQGAVAELEAKLEGNAEETQDIDFDFLRTLANWEYIADYGFDTNDRLTILFDSWRQLEGKDDKPSVFAKLVKLAEAGKLKPSINYTLTNMDTAFTDEYRKCDRCGRVISAEWEGLHLIESECVEVCSDCLDKDLGLIEELIEDAKDDFKKALPVGVSIESLHELGYEELNSEQAISTRFSQWGEKSWEAYNFSIGLCEEICKKYDGFAKITYVAQFESEFQLMFPKDRVQEARLELGIIQDTEEIHNIGVEV